MLDSDLAEIYGYEVKYLNRQVKRNIERFPEDFMFQVTKEEVERKLDSLPENAGHIYDNTDKPLEKIINEIELNDDKVL